MNNYETERVLEILKLDENLVTCLKQASNIQTIKPILWTILSTSYNWDSIALSQIDCKKVYNALG